MDNIIRTLLLEWRQRTLPSVISREVSLDVSQTQVNNATVVTGFRRSGKTYILFQAIEKLLHIHTREDVVYVNFEDERLIAPCTALLTNLIPEIQAVYGKKPVYLFLDELQLVPNWSKWVRRILDTENIRLFIIGSSSKMGSHELPTELRGRAWEIQVQPLTFREFLRFKQKSLEKESVTHVKEEAARFRFLYDEFLLYGSLPAVVLTPEEKKLELLQSYFQTVVQMDMVERHKIENDRALKALLQILVNSPYITISKLANTLKSMQIPVGKTTVDKYLDYIEESYFAKQLYFHSPSVINQLQYPRKMYIIDSGFVSALSTKFSKNMGRLFEHAVYRHFESKKFTLYYFRDERDIEADFVVLGSDGKTSAIYQACYDVSDAETVKREIHGLLKAGKVLNCANLHIVTIQKPTRLDLPKGIKLLSAADLFL